MTSHVSALAAAAAAANGVSARSAWAPPMGVTSVLPQQLLASNFLCTPATSLARVLPARSEAPATAPANPSDVGPASVKEIIRHNRCTLFPQNPNLPPPSTRPRPPGCKTVFVGGLPENAGDDIIREVFSPCGDIVALRKSKKNFCHIRFSDEFMVDAALGLSGYRLHVASGTDKKDSGKIHVDFAQARDDLYEWECKQRLREREKRHQHRDEALPPPTSASPTLMPRFSEHEAAMLAERLKVEQVWSVLVASGRQKSRDRFSKAQRKNIDVWTRQCQVDSEEVSALRRQDEEEDDEGPFQKKMKMMCAQEDDAFEEEEELLRKEAEPQRLEAGTCLLPVQQVSAFHCSYADRETRGGGCGPGGGAGGSVLVSEKEALLLGVVSAFLHVHPFGANLEYLCSYVRTLDSQVSSSELESLMVRLPLMFRQELSGVGATLEKRWKFCAFDSLQSG
ncbi:ecto-NOX disulfide-thiol exchanger 1-like isoform X3 [Festucalex cinctus]